MGSDGDLERAAPRSKQLETGIFLGVFPQVVHQLHVVVADVQRALLMFVCRGGETPRVCSNVLPQTRNVNTYC